MTGRGDGSQVTPPEPEDDDAPTEPDTGETRPQDDPDADSAPTRGGSNVPNAGRDPGQGRTE
jgi:hypothetical protein